MSYSEARINNFTIFRPSKMLGRRQPAIFSRPSILLAQHSDTSPALEGTTSRCDGPFKTIETPLTHGGNATDPQQIKFKSRGSLSPQSKNLNGKISVAVRFRPSIGQESPEDRQWRVEDNRIFLCRPLCTPIFGVSFAFGT